MRRISNMWDKNKIAQKETITRLAVTIRLRYKTTEKNSYNTEKGNTTTQFGDNIYPLKSKNNSFTDNNQTEALSAHYTVMTKKTKQKYQLFMALLHYCVWEKHKSCIWKFIKYFSYAQKAPENTELGVYIRYE